MYMRFGPGYGGPFHSGFWALFLFFWLVIHLLHKAFGRNRVERCPHCSRRPAQRR